MRDPNRPTYSRWSRRKGGYKLCPRPDCGHKHPEVMRIDGRPQRPKTCIKCGEELPAALSYPKKCEVVWYVREFDPLTGDTRDIACTSAEAADELIRQRQRDWTPDPIQSVLMEQASVTIRRMTDPAQQKLMETFLSVVPGITAADLDSAINALIVKLGGDISLRTLRPITWDKAIETITDELRQKGKSPDYVEATARAVGDFRSITGLAEMARADLECVAKFRKVRLAGGWQRKSKTMKPASGSTVNRDLATLAAFFTRAARKGWVASNPLKGAEDERVKVAAPRVAYMTDSELNMLIDGAPTTWLRTLLIVAYYTGGRRGDLLSLEWESDVDLDGTKGAGDGRMGPSIFIRGQKADTPHWVPLHPAAVEALRKLRAEPFVGPRVFPLKMTGKRIPATRVSARFAKLCRTVGLTAERKAADGSVRVVNKFKFHDLRKKNSTDLRNAGASPKERAALLGHRTIRVNETHYEAILPARNRELVDVLPSFGVAV